MHAPISHRAAQEVEDVREKAMFQASTGLSDNTLSYPKEPHERASIAECSRAHSCPFGCSCSKKEQTNRASWKTKTVIGHSSSHISAGQVHMKLR